jgi:hypothetical protein
METKMIGGAVLSQQSKSFVINSGIVMPSRFSASRSNAPAGSEQLSLTPKNMEFASKKLRALLALDGVSLSPKLLTMAARRSVQIATKRIDILLVNPPQAPISVLWGLLYHLEHSGIYYRLVSTKGELGEQVLAYLNRCMGINAVLSDKVAVLEKKFGAEVDALRNKGCRFMPIFEPCPAKQS